MKLSLSSSVAAFGLLAATGFPGAVDAQVLEDGKGVDSRRVTNDRVGSSEGAEFLLLPTGARSVAMGGAVAASRGSGESVLWSPAGLAALENKRLMFNHSESAFDTETDVVALLWPAKSVGTVGVTYYLVDFGQLANTSADGTVQGNITFRNQEFLVSFARELIGSLEAGISYKLIQLVFRCDGQCPDQRSFTRSTHALDLGLIYNEPIGLPLALGGSIRHLGFPLEGESEEDRLPTRIRVGLSYEALSSFTSDSIFALALAVDVEQRWHDPGQPDIMFGSEFGVADRFFLRAGYAFHEARPDGPAVGLGLIHEWFYLDLSRGFDNLAGSAEDDLLQVSLGVIF